MKNTIEFYLKRFQQIVVFLVGKAILKNYKTFDEYKSAKNSGKAYCLNSAIEYYWQNSLTTFRIDGKLTHHLTEFIEKSSNLFIFHKHCHKTFKTEKKFSRNSWFELDDDIVHKLFEDPEAWTTSNEKLLSKDAHRWIDKNIYAYATEQDMKTMTKTEVENLKRECEQGLHALPFETLKKDAEKKERRMKKTQERRIKKIAQKTLVEEQTKIAKLEAENAELRSQLEILKNADIENAELNEKIQKMEASAQKFKAFAKKMKEITSDIDKLESWYEKMAQKLLPEDNKPANVQQNETKDTIDDSQKTQDSCKIGNSTTQQMSSRMNLNDDISEDISDLAKRSKVTPKIEYFANKSYIGPTAAKRLGKIYRRPVNICPTYETEKLQANVHQRMLIYKTAIEELAPFERELDKDDVTWLVHEYRTALKSDKVLANLA